MPRYQGKPKHQPRPVGPTPREMETARLAISEEQKAALRQSVKRLNPDYSEEELDTFLAGR